jgi:hypothetical protein
MTTRAPSRFQRRLRVVSLKHPPPAGEPQRLRTRECYFCTRVRRIINRMLHKET